MAEPSITATPDTPSEGALLAPAAIHYHPGGYSTRQERLLGRQAAGEGFLAAFARSAAEESIAVYVHAKAHFDECVAALKDAGYAGPGALHIQPPAFAALERAGCLYRPDPLLAPAAFLRLRHSSRAYSLCGVTHTVSSAGAMDGMAQLLTAPLRPWDAIVCTSQAVKSALTRYTDHYADYLQGEFGFRPGLRCELPVIPLGVDCNRFPPRHSMERQRQSLRARLGIAEHDVAALFFGRLSFHAKAHPMPMFLALEAAAQRSSTRLHLIMAGWFANRAIETQFLEGARTFAPSIGLHVLDGRLPQIRAEAWYGADFFVSLSDNIQETFGLAPIEAMAAGLACVVSDWDGYKETIRDGIDGYRVPTLAAAPTEGTHLSLAFEADAIDYDRFIGEASLQVAVNVRAASEACSALASNAEQRRRMGTAARERAEKNFSWDVVMRAYRALWSELDLRRRASQPEAEETTRPARQTGIARPDPFSMFAAYPTLPLRADTRFAIAPGLTADRLAKTLANPMNVYGSAPLPDRAGLDALLARIESAPVMAVSDLLAGLQPGQRSRMKRTLLWLAKMGLLVPV